MGGLPGRLRSEWSPDNVLSPDDVTAKSSKVVRWVCSVNHSWAAPVSRRSNGSGCPYCAGKLPVVGVNDFATTHPVLASQWHPSLNKGLSPEGVKAGSNRKVWWLCEAGHSWEAQPNSRANSGHGCPYCSGSKVSVEVNSLSALFPAVAAEWHPTKNGELTPAGCHSNSGRKVWWLCYEDSNHEWESKVYSRTTGGNGCPFCGHRRLHASSNSLTVLNPELASELHPTRNGEMTGEDILNGSKTKYWWLGTCGHEWEATPGDRVRLGHGCPFCSHQRVLVGFNDLATLHPTLVPEWHPTLNGDFTPESVSLGGHRKAWWLGACKHEWEANIYHRTKGVGCPTCSAQKFNYVSQPEKDLFEFLSSLGFNPERSNRSLLKNVRSREIDLYIPEKKLGVEFNGLYWHSENAGKDKNYHHEKWLAAKEAGIQLVQVWEDDWNRNPELVKRMLAHKLGVSQQRTVYARKTQVEELAKADAESFLDEYHVQGHVNGSYYLGLRDIETCETVAVLVLKKESGVDGAALNILRYATSVNVIGGFTKLLKHSERTYKPNSFLTFSDHCVSDGGLYENNDFVADKELPPDYMYIVNGERKHKFGYRLKRFRNDPTLKFEEGLTERELAELNNLPRIWDAGKTRWVK